MDFRQINEVTEAAIEAENNEFIANRWVIEGYSRRINLNEYKDLLNPKPKDRETAEETLSRVEKLVEGLDWRRKDNGNI